MCLETNYYQDCRFKQNYILHSAGFYWVFYVSFSGRLFTFHLHSLHSTFDQIPCSFSSFCQSTGKYSMAKCYDLRDLRLFEHQIDGFLRPGAKYWDFAYEFKENFPCPFQTQQVNLWPHSRFLLGSSFCLCFQSFHFGSYIGPFSMP